MGVNSGGAARPNGSSVGGGKPTPAGTARAPRRLVLLQDADNSAVSHILAEYQGADISGTRIHQDVQRFAAEHQGQCVAVEWLGALGWTRYLWCRK